jgi:HSP20 family protein
MQYQSTQNGETIQNGEQCCAPTNTASVCTPRVNQASTTSQSTVTQASANAKQTQGASFAATPRYRTTTGDDGVSLRVELPGVGQEALSLTVEDGVLSLDAKQSLSPAGSEVLRQALEFRLTDFRGRWRLPENIDVDAIASTLRHGVLEVTLPLKKPARRTISIA